MPALSGEEVDGRAASEAAAGLCEKAGISAEHY
jgi:hypothetical protein